MRPVLLYLALVGLPILAVCGLLHMGERLSAPVSVAGTWSAQLSFPESLAGDPMISPGVKVLTISQSGPQVFLTFDDERKTTLAGKINETAIYAGVLDGAAIKTGTNRPTAISFHGRVNRQTEPDQLSGVLILDRGPVRTEIPLTALRLNGSPIVKETH